MIAVGFSLRLPDYNIEKYHALTLAVTINKFSINVFLIYFFNTPAIFILYKIIIGDRVKKIVFSEIDLVNGGASYVCECNSPNMASIKNIMRPSVFSGPNDKIVRALSSEDARIKCMSVCYHLGGLNRLYKIA